MLNCKKLRRQAGSCKLVRRRARTKGGGPRDETRIGSNGKGSRGGWAGLRDGVTLTKVAVKFQQKRQAGLLWSRTTGQACRTLAARRRRRRKSGRRPQDDSRTDWTGRWKRKARHHRHVIRPAPLSEHPVRGHGRRDGERVRAGQEGGVRRGAEARRSPSSSSARPLLLCSVLSLSRSPRLLQRPRHPDRFYLPSITETDTMVKAGMFPPL